MIPSTQNYETLGQFYLGREMDPVTGKPDGGLVLYDSKDLVTHGVVLGMTGSGKTGLCLALLEEAAMDNIPAIVIDPKGDIANLMLAFPDMVAADFLPWVPEAEAAQKGMSVEQYAEQTAARWKEGLSAWGQSPERVKAFREKVDVTLFTPGSNAGIPVSILGSLQAPASEVLEDAEIFHEVVSNTVSSLLSLASVRDETGNSKESVLLSTIFQHSWRAGENLSLETLIHQIQSPSFDRVGVMDMETFMPSKARTELAMKFNSLVASPGFSLWLEGVPLDVDRMLHDSSGKPRISIFSIAHLNDEDRMFFMSLLLNQMLGWMRRQQGTTSLRALLYIDEIFGYLPPIANPPSKRPLMTLLKQSRAFGLGCLLATQNPVDLDYKALSNIGTWILGRLQTERDKARVLDGLESAAGGGAYQRSELERLLSGLGNRVFLMKNVHEDGPVLFQARWVMSYLAGPLTRTQIKNLMDPKRGAWQDRGQANHMPIPVREDPPPADTRPTWEAGFLETFMEPRAVSDGAIYRPYLMSRGSVHFASAKWGVDAHRSVVTAYPMGEKGILWEQPLEMPTATVDKPTTGLGFATLPDSCANAWKNRAVEKEYADWLYRNVRAEVFTCPKLKVTARFGEKEGEFRARMTHHAGEARDREVEQLRASASKKLVALQEKLRVAENQFEREKAEAGAATMQAGLSIFGSLLGGLFGRKTRMSSMSRVSSAAHRASQAYKQHQDVSAVTGKVQAVQAQLVALETEISAAIDTIVESYEVHALEIVSETIRPTREQVKVIELGLLWLPFTAHGDRAW